MADSAAIASEPARCPAPRHGTRSPPWRTPNRLAQNGKSAAASERATAYTRATRIASSASFRRLGCPRALFGETQAPCNFALQLRESQIQNAFARIEHNIEWPFTSRRGKPHRFPHSPLDSVAFDRAAQHFSDRETHARAALRCAIVLAPQVKDRHVAGKLPPAALVYPLKIRMLQQALRLRDLAGGGHVCRHSRLIGRTSRHDQDSYQLTIFGHLGSRVEQARFVAYSRKPGFTETRLRPLARRRESTARPLLVFMRERKPCVFERRRRLGWNVRFGMRKRRSSLAKSWDEQTESITAGTPGWQPEKREARAQIAA